MVEHEISYAAEEIVEAHNNPLGGFKGFIVEGKLRTGKTAYAIKVVRDVLMALHPELTVEEAYRQSLDYIFFEVDPFLKIVEAKHREIREHLPKIDWTLRIPVLVLDDASLYAGSDMYFKDQMMYSAFQNTMTTIGSAVSGVIITAPVHDALTKCLREYYSYYIVRIVTDREVGSDYRDAKIYEWYRKPSRTTLGLKLVAVDVFTPRVPFVYSEYLKKRLVSGEMETRKALEISAMRKAEMQAQIQVELQAAQQTGQGEEKEGGKEEEEQKEGEETTGRRRKKRTRSRAHFAPELTGIKLLR